MRYYEILSERTNVNPNLLRWFGNSKIVNDDGTPRVVYHGTGQDITKFEKTHNGAGSRESKLGYWFTNDTHAADGFAQFSRGNANIVPVYLKMEHPLVVKDYNEIRDIIDRHTKFERPTTMMQGRPIRMVFDKMDHDAAVAELKQKYDGIILKNTMVDSVTGEPIDQYVVFDKNQIKSAIGNTGNYSPDKEEIHEDDVLKLGSTMRTIPMDKPEANDEPTVIKLAGFGKPRDTNGVKAFMEEFYSITKENPFNPRRVVYGSASLEVSIWDNMIHVSDIQSHEKGSGQKALRMLCDLADKHRVKIELTAKGYAHTPTSSLVNLYKSYGFMKISELEDDYFDDEDDGIDMMRYPN